MNLVDPALVGYCTNVHAGQDLETSQSQLATHAVAVRDSLQQATLPVGLWLSQQTAAELKQSQGKLDAFADWLKESGLVPYTLNGFPFGNFHQEVVKHQVYLPTWADAQRLHYTSDLADLLVTLLKRSGHPNCGTGTISTLPIGWPTGDLADPASPALQQAANNLLQLVEHLEELHESSETQIKVCIEPEPGCVLGDMPATLEYFEKYLLAGDTASRDRVTRYLSVCYDICHSAVMNESAEDNLNRLRQLGLSIGKVQVSSAITVDFEALKDETQKQTAWQRLQSFNEPRYLHQTAVYHPEHEAHYFEDLPQALAEPSVARQGRWVVHFHVPISEEKAGILDTTQQHITQFISTCHHLDVKPIHWEVETYAWNVLPEDMKRATLAEGIADEIRTLQHWLSPS